MNKVQLMLGLCLVTKLTNAQIADPKRIAERKATERANGRVD